MFFGFTLHFVVLLQYGWTLFQKRTSWSWCILRAHNSPHHTHTQQTRFFLFSACWLGRPLFSPYFRRNQFCLLQKVCNNLQQQHKKQRTSPDILLENKNMTKQQNQTKTGTKKHHNQFKPARIDKSVLKHCDPKASLSKLKGVI